MLNGMQTYGPLDNYILANRKQSGLSQHDVAFLLDIARQRLARFEDQGELPHLRSAIGLELIFEEPMQSLFAGVAHKMRSQVVARARSLLVGMSEKPTADNAQRLATLDILGHLDEDVTPWRDLA